MFDKIKKMFTKTNPSGVVYTSQMDELLGDKESVDVTKLLQNQVKNNRLEIRDKNGNVILRIPDPKKFPGVWSDIL